jgi:hypothetical protein
MTDTRSRAFQSSKFLVKRFPESLHPVQTVHRFGLFKPASASAVQNLGEPALTVASGFKRLPCVNRRVQKPPDEDETVEIQRSLYAPG